MDPLGKSSHFLPIHSLPISFREWCTFFLNTLTFIGKLLSFLERRKKKKKKFVAFTVQSQPLSGGTEGWANEKISPFSYGNSCHKRQTHRHTRVYPISMVRHKRTHARECFSVFPPGKHYGVCMYLCIVRQLARLALRGVSIRGALKGVFAFFSRGEQLSYNFGTVANLRQDLRLNLSKFII